MTLPESKATTPFKTMDIKTALLSGVNRKRKISTTQVCKDEPKNKKLSIENNEQDEVKIIDEACGITITLQPSELDSTLGDCKENKDINAAKCESPIIDSSEKNLCIANEERSSNSVTVSCSKLSNLDSPKSPKVVSDNDVELLSDVSKKSDDSSDEHNNSADVSLNTSGHSIAGEDELNNSVNVSLNTSGHSATGEDDDKGSDSKSEKNKDCKDMREKSQSIIKDKVKKRKMTAAEAQKKATEREQKQKEKLLKKEELENKKRERLLEKEQKQKEKMIRKEREEMEKKERERIKLEKKEQEEKERLQKQKEKEEKAKIKQIQLELKLEEKKRKEEQKLKKEEEMKKAEEDKLRAKLEKEQKDKEKQERAKAAFAKFFLKAETNTSAPPTQAADKEGAFLPFQVSDDMTLAPVVPPAAQERFDKKQLDHYLERQDGIELYLQILKSRSYKDVRQRKKNRKIEDPEADVIILDTNAQAELGLHPKLLQFCENVRPPYWGTWRKKSKNVHPRNPFGQDDIFDYDVDSDDEWDEGGPGESLSGTENEDESEDDYEVDNEFFVPHGYLSDEEEKKEDEDDEEVNDPEKQKALLKLKLQEFEMERKKKTTELNPIYWGCYFVNKPASQDNGFQMILQTYTCEILSDTPIPTSFSVKSQPKDCSNNTTESPKSANNGSSVKKKRILRVPEEAFPQLIRLVHGNTKKKSILIKEFQKFWAEQSKENPEAKQETVEPTLNIESDPSKENVGDRPSGTNQISITLLNQTISEIASYGKSPDSTFNKSCWLVHDNVREKYGLMNAPIPNQWKYLSQKEPDPVSKVASIKGFLSSN